MGNLVLRLFSAIGPLALATIAAAALTFGFWWLIASTSGVSGDTPLYSVFLYPGLIKPEPVENKTFIFGVITACMAVTFAALYRHKIPLRLSIAGTIFGAAAALILLALIDWPSLLPPAHSTPVQAAINNPGLFIAATLGIAAVLAALAKLGSRRWVVPIVAYAPFVVWLINPVLFGTHDHYVAGTHFEVFVYPIIQDWLGAGIHLSEGGVRSQYGLYPIFLRPVWALVGGPWPGSISITMAAILVLSHGALITFMARFTTRPVLGASFAITAILVASLLYPFWPGDAYFEFFPVRLAFPALSLLLLCHRLTRERFALVSYIILGSGLLWNFESGLVALFAFYAFNCSLAFWGEWRPFIRFAARHAAMALVAVLVAATGLILYYLIRFSTLPEYAGIIESISAFSSGVGAEPMAPFGAWWLHALVYTGALYFGIRTLLSSRDRGYRMRAAALVTMAVIGIIWLKYYQGRSVPLALAFVSWPAICCLGLMADKAIGAIKTRQWLWAAFVSIVVTAPTLAATLVWLSTNPIPHRSLSAALAQHNPASFWNQTAAEIAGRFAEVRTHEQDELFVLAPYAHIIALHSGEPVPIPSAGMCQIWYKDEAEAIVKTLRDPATKMVVVDNTDSCLPAQSPETDSMTWLQEYQEAEGLGTQPTARVFVRP